MRPLTSHPAGKPCPVPLVLARDGGDLIAAVRRGELARVRRGAYTPATAWHALPPWDRYLARVHAVAAVSPDAVFCYESAAALLGLPVFGDPLIVHTVADERATSRLSGSVRLHTRSTPADVVDLGGARVTSATTTTVDIARERHEALALAVVDAALRRDGQLNPEMLVAENESRIGSRGRARARWALARGRPEPESPFESVSRAAIEWLGLAPPELQVWFAHTDGHRDRVDMWWRGSRTIGEADGDLKYDGSLGAPTIALKARRARDGRLRPRCDHIAHWSWDDVIDFSQLRGILHEAGVPRIQSEHTAALWSMQRVLRAATRGHETAPHPRNSV